MKTEPTNEEKNVQLCEKLGWTKHPDGLWNYVCDEGECLDQPEDALPNHFADSAEGLWERKQAYESLDDMNKIRVEQCLRRAQNDGLIHELMLKPILAEALWRTLCATCPR